MVIISVQKRTHSKTSADNKILLNFELNHEVIKNICIQDLLFEQARIQPNNIAIIDEHNSLTYKQLTKEASKLANYLQYLGIFPNDCIGLFFEPCVELITSVWGVLISNAAYLPLSPEYPEERLKYMIKDSRTTIIITQTDLKKRLLKFVSDNIKIITLDDARKFKTLKNMLYFNSNTYSRGNNLAYVIYTSGSTGKPKGVMIEHHSIVNQMNWLKNTFALDNNSIVIQKTPMSFDAAQWEILASSCGSQIIIGRSGIYKNVELLIKTIKTYNVTILQCVPTLLQALVDTHEFSECNSLKYIFSGGEVLLKNLAINCIKLLPQCQLVNLYGPTECTINSSFFIINPSITIEKSTKAISIGKPIDNTQYYILDNHYNPLDINEIGELYIGGSGLARGYLHQPELTAEKFIINPFNPNNENRLYKTGDLAYWNFDGTVQYVGRVDSQVKLRGYRIELNEITLAIQTHDWVKHAAVILKNDEETGYQNLIAYIELNPKEAALMDQGNHDAHHQSKQSKIQVMMQLSNSGCRSNLPNQSVIQLPGKIPTNKQWEQVFARKTYRFYEGHPVTKKNILQLLGSQLICTQANTIENLSFENFGEILRYFGQFISEERLLPKYAYASPGALNATQIYFELNDLYGLQPGFYYYHPVHHELILIQHKLRSQKKEIKIHFIGKKSAIEPIYKNNIQEVLEIETGHIVGLFEKILSEYGLSIKDCEFTETVKKHLDVPHEDFYLGTFEILSGQNQMEEPYVDIYVQSHPNKIEDLKAGSYHYENGNLEKISDEYILKKDVIAINQEVYNRSFFGITLISNTHKKWMHYIDLGRKLQLLQMNDLNIGLMSSGYSSKTGNDLPSAKSIRKILNKDIGPSYFFIGGGISDEQKKSQGMNEDVVHMKGPAEMIKDDLINYLPSHMIPNQVIVLNEMPLTANGKLDLEKLRKRDVVLIKREYISPRNELEQKIYFIWKNALKKEDISINDNFFELGGNSLIAVTIISQLNITFGCSLPQQTLFESPTIEKIAYTLTNHSTNTSFRLIPLQKSGEKTPIFCWPGLGGYCMNLRALAKKMGDDQPFYGIQAYGINENEIPYSSIQEMAAEDIKIIKNRQSSGPYILWGYSFGARVAFEVAFQLEKMGEKVEKLFLIAPGSPKIQLCNPHNSNPNFRNKAYHIILFSVFMRTITHDYLNECLFIEDEENFIQFISNKTNLPPQIIKRIMTVVSKTYSFQYKSEELKERKLNVPITIFKTKSDNDSFIENHDTSWFNSNIITLEADHYSVLKDPFIDTLIKIIKEI